MTPEDAKRLYAGTKGEHTAFEQEFRDLCDRYQVQASVFYAGFDRIVMSGRVYNRQQLTLILEAAADMIPEIIEGAKLIVSGNSGRVWLRADKDAP